VAYIVKGQGTAPAYSSALAHAPFDRQRDIFKLAKMGSGDCRRMWNDFASEVPAMARLVVADVENELREDARVTKSVDKRLRRAEKVVTKARKPKVTKGRKKAPATGAGLDALGQARALLADPVLAHSNPVHREWAYQAALRRD
jgi:hypothetical protein